MYPSPRHEEIQNAVKAPKKTAASSAPLSRLGKTIYWPFDLIFNKAFQLEAMKALALPVVLGVLLSWTTQRLQWEANQNQILKDYFSQLETLVLKANLMEETPKAGSIILARGRTIAALSELDLKRKNQLLAFLSASGLTEVNEGQADAIISFNGQRLSAIDLRGANLGGVNLTRVNLNQGNLYKARFHSANLNQAGLGGANLMKTILINANLSEANLSQASLRKSDLYWANASKASFDMANLSDADLSDANFSEASFYRANLNNANLHKADLHKADLFEANLNDALLIATDLRETANLTPEQLTGDNQPYLCGAALPSNITGIDPNRDCDALLPILLKKYKEELVYESNPREEIKRTIEQAQNKQWD